MGEGVPSLPWGQAFIATLAVLALLAAALWLLRRTMSRTGGRAASMRVEGSLALGERRSLVIVDVEGRRLLVGLAPGHVALVTELQASAPASPVGERAS
ncbi:MAG: flagellar biosynthetic protein FliO [Vicinamibacterales bacterium]|jgi:flagellar protein FliO/FliZ